MEIELISLSVDVNHSDVNYYRDLKNTIDIFGMSTLLCYDYIVISTNKVYFVYKCSQTYLRLYEKWVHGAISDFVEKVDNTSHIELIRHSKDVYYDIVLEGSIDGKMTSKKCRVFFLKMKEDKIELFFDTIVFDNFVF